MMVSDKALLIASLPPRSGATGASAPVVPGRPVVVVPSLLRVKPAKTNAQSVKRWISSTHLSRAGGLTVDPNDCSITPSTGTVPVTLDRCFDETLTAAGGPLTKFKNPYDPAPNAPILAYTGTAMVDGNACSTATASIISRADGTRSSATPVALTNEDFGVIIVSRSGTANLIAKTNNILNVGYCDKDGKYASIGTDLAF